MQSYDQFEQQRYHDWEMDCWAASLMGEEEPSFPNPYDQYREHVRRSPLAEARRLADAIDAETDCGITAAMQIACQRLGVNW